MAWSVLIRRRAIVEEVLILLALLAILIPYLGLTPIYGMACECGKESYEEGCHVVTVLTAARCWIERHNELVIALATAVVAFFTFTLWRATDRLKVLAELQRTDTIEALAISRKSADAARDSADVARATLIATKRAWITIEIAPSGPFWSDEHGLRFNVKHTYKNVGESPAVNVTIGFDLVGDGNREESDSDTVRRIAGNKREKELIFPGRDGVTESTFKCFERPHKPQGGAIELVFWVSYELTVDPNVRHYSAVFFNVFSKDPQVAYIHVNSGRAEMESMAYLKNSVYID